MIAISRRQFVASLGVLAGGAAVGGVSRAKVAEAATALPDVIVTALYNFSPVSAGQVVAFGAKIKNQGTAATPAGMEIGVAFRIDGKEVSWSGTDVAALPAGQSIVLTANRGGVAGNGTWTATPGSHTLEAVVNDVHRFAETSVSNNSFGTKFAVAATTTKPVNISLPVISGTAVVGDTLTASTGTWS